jgi:competence protein ComEC
VSTAHLFTMLAAFLGGILSVDIPIYRRAIILMVGSVIFLAPRVRSIFVCALACGVVTAALHATATLQQPTFITPTAVVVVEQSATDNGTFDTLRLNNGKQLQAWFPQQTAPALAHAISITGLLVPFDDARNPGAISPHALAQNQGLWAQLLHARVLRDNGVERGNPSTWLPRARAWALRCINEQLDPVSAGLLTGALWGERAHMAPEIHAAFVATGTVHVLVTAGLHVGIMAGLFLALFRCLRFGRVGSALATVPLVLLYAAFAGAHIPVMRAAITTACVLLARASGADVAGLRSFALAVLVDCALAPAAPTGPAFWLSVCCVATILVFSKPMEARTLWLPRMLRAPISVSLAAQIGTWPLVAAMFHIVSLSAPLANLIVIPLISLELACGVVLLALDVSSAALCHVLPVAFQAPSVLAHTIIAIVIGIAHVPQAAVTTSSPSLVSLCTYYIMLAVAGWLCINHARADVRFTQWHLRLTPRAASAVLIALAQLIPIAAIAAHAWSQPLTLTMLDVGQGDGMVLETPHHHIIILDTGGKLELHAGQQLTSPAERAGASVLLPFLAYQGIHRVDLLVLTHPHGDHVGGAAPLLHTIPVERIWDSGQPYGGRAYQDAMSATAVLHLPVHIARRGDTYDTDDGVHISVLAPFARPLPPSPNSINEGSIVLRIAYREQRWLFMGDAGIPTEMRLLAAGDTLSSTLLKVGHHGSAGASDPAFLAAVHPTLALISVGRHNLFHHPAASTLQTLNSLGVEVLRTDQCGAIAITPDGVTSMVSCSVKISH